MVFTEGTVDAAGFSVRYWEAGQGRPVIMLDQTGWRNTMLHGALAEKYHIFSLELPGMGDSAVNSTSQTVGDLATVAAAAATTLTSEKYTLIGSSFGANVALCQAVQSPHQVEALILVSPMAILPQESKANASSQEAHSMMFAHEENAQKFNPLSAEVFAKETELMARLSVVGHDALVEAKLGDIHCPTLAIFGKNDRLVSSESARVYREKIPNNNIAIVYDAGHCIVGDRPEALVNSVIDYAEHWETFIVGHKTGVINP